MARCILSRWRWVAVLLLALFLVLLLLACRGRLDRVADVRVRLLECLNQLFGGTSDGGLVSDTSHLSRPVCNLALTHDAGLRSKVGIVETLVVHHPGGDLVDLLGFGHPGVTCETAGWIGELESLASVLLRVMRERHECAAIPSLRVPVGE